MFLMQNKIEELFNRNERRKLERRKNTVAFGNLILEITRRCNLHCLHCLRGDAQQIDMDEKTIVKAVNMATSVDSITFTGGEPTLRIDLIELTYELLLEKFGFGHLPSFFIATNGYGDQVRLSTILLKWYAASMEKEMCEACISEDIFHGEFDQVNYLSGLVFHSKAKTHSLSESEEDASWILREGRGEYIPVSSKYKARTVPAHAPLTVYEFGNEIFIDQTYISALEEVSSECDYSFESLAENHVCKLDELHDYIRFRRYKED